LGAEPQDVEISLIRIRRAFAYPRKHVERFATPGQVVADPGCGTGYYTIHLAECVGPAGKVYAVDVNPVRIRTVARRAIEHGFRNIDAHATSASDLGSSRMRRLTSFSRTDCSAEWRISESRP
jgi:ubiquinone/menaquinone biosynthesis C-methylase UbiE